MSGRPNTVEEHKQYCKGVVDVLLASIIGKDAVRSWWDSSNVEFDLKTPNQQWEEDYRPVYCYVKLQWIKK